jgi:hypothetical protein
MARSSEADASARQLHQQDYAGWLAPVGPPQLPIDVLKRPSGRANEGLEGEFCSSKCEEQQPGTAHPNYMNLRWSVLEARFGVTAAADSPRQCGVGWSGQMNQSLSHSVGY